MNHRSLPVILRVIAFPADIEAALSRLSTLCKEQGMTDTVTQDESYRHFPRDGR